MANGRNDERKAKGMDEQTTEKKDQAIAEALEICRSFRKIVNPENSWEDIGMQASDWIQEIEWALGAVTDESPGEDG